MGYNIGLYYKGLYRDVTRNLKVARRVSKEINSSKLICAKEKQDLKSNDIHHSFLTFVSISMRPLVVVRKRFLVAR